MRIRRTIEDASGKHRVKIRQWDNGFKTEQWEVVKKRWRRVESLLDGRIFESYSAALYAVGLRNSWLGKVLMDELGTGSGYQLEFTRGLTYTFEVFRCDMFGDHDHCSNCWAKLMEIDAPETQHEGYVTKYVFPDNTGDWQWTWVCRACFAALRERLQWQVIPPPAD